MNDNKKENILLGGIDSYKEVITLSDYFEKFIYSLYYYLNNNFDEETLNENGIYKVARGYKLKNNGEEYDFVCIPGKYQRIYMANQIKDATNCFSFYSVTNVEKCVTESKKVSFTNKTKDENNDVKETYLSALMPRANEKIVLKDGVYKNVYVGKEINDEPKAITTYPSFEDAYDKNWYIVTDFIEAWKTKLEKLNLKELKKVK